MEEKYISSVKIEAEGTSSTYKIKDAEAQTALKNLFSVDTVILDCGTSTKNIN